ncbi:ABC transporter ATP-binding protein [Clostridiales bacterium COT073_COT-073]|nr:ABC transporter ATP-binding protein [Clostridiales bacterium COT073_COT-073]
MNMALTLDKVSKRYESSGFWLKDISFNLPEGSILGFIGQNGAGKTTTISCILNTIKKDNGRIMVLGREMTDQTMDIKEEIGVVFDGDNFPPYLSAEELSKVMSGIYRKWDQPLFCNYLQRFKLPLRQKIKSFSRGMSMQLAIAVALAHHPRLLLLDEATGGLDPLMRDEILDILLEFVQTEDHSILLSSHITGDLEKIADHIVLIDHGEIILNKPKDELIYDYGIMRCLVKELPEVDPEDIISYRKREFQVDILVADKDKLSRKYKKLTIDNTTLDEIMLLLVKGEKA